MYCYYYVDIGHAAQSVLLYCKMQVLDYQILWAIRKLITCTQTSIALLLRVLYYNNIIISQSIAVYLSHT